MLQTGSTEGSDRAAPLRFSPTPLYDAIVVGGGPAGLTAALYLARARCRVLVVEKSYFGGQIALTAEVLNYPGVLQTDGAELTETMRRQAENFGAEFLTAEAQSLDLEGDVKVVHTSKGDRYAFGVLLATGAQPRAAGFRGEEEHKGRGVSYCATCDGALYAGKDVFVIGGGYAAAEESVFLAKLARHVTVLIRKDGFSCAPSVAAQVLDHDNITVLTHTVAEEVAGSGGLDYLRYRNTQTGKVTEFRAAPGERFGVFVFAGYEPNSALVRGIAALDTRGCVLTDGDQRTSVEGLYAAGDLCAKPLRQVVTAVGEGALAATALEKYAAAQQEKTGLRPTKAGPRKALESETAGPAFHAWLTPEIEEQLRTILQRMDHALVLKLYLDDRPISAELEDVMNALARLTGKLTVKVQDRHAPSDSAPCVRICREDGSETGLAFHGVPVGRQFTAFVLGLCNAAGRGQALDADVEAEIMTLREPVDLKVLVSLACALSPALVAAAQQIAAISPCVTAEVYVLDHFPALRERYGATSVPCLVVGESQVSFGRKDVRQVLELIKRPGAARVEGTATRTVSA